MKKLKHKFIAALVFLAVGSPSHAALMNLEVNGLWGDIFGAPNLSIVFSLDSLAGDLNASSSIGEFRVQAVNFNFKSLGVFQTPFTLVGDAQNTLLYSYPDLLGQGGSELRLNGFFDSNHPFPNGIQATEFDLRLSLESTKDDSLETLFKAASTNSTSLYLSDQIGARSSLFSNSNYLVTSAVSPVPEIESSHLMFIGLLFIAFMLARKQAGDKSVVNVL